MTYDAFVSYGHAADGQLAPAIESGLQRLAKPWYRLRALHIFRDETGLSTNPHLWPSIEAALDTSEWFILLASPEAARSPWVEKELEHWLATKPASRILTVATDGEVAWDSARNDFAADATAIPDTLHGVFDSEPRYLDLRWARSETDLDLRNSRFRDAIADLAAPLHGVAKDELESEDIRQYRHTRRLARGGVTILALLLVISLIASVVALDQRDTANRQRNRANDQARIADARRLAAQAVSGTNVELDRSLLLALEGRRLHDSPETRGALLTAVTRSRNLRFTLRGFGHGIEAATLSRDGQTLVLAGSDSVVRFVDVGTRRVISTLPVTGVGHARSVALDPDGHLLAVATERGTVWVYDLRVGRTVRPGVEVRGASIREIVYSPDGRRLAALDDNGVGALWSVPSLEEEGRFSTTVIPAHYDVAFSPDGRLLAVSGSPGFVLDVASATPVSLRPVAPDVREAEAGIAFSPDGVTVAVVKAVDHLIAFRNARTGQETRSPLTTEGVPVDVLAYSSDGRYLAGARSDSIVLLWNLASSQPAPTMLIGSSGRADMLAFAPSADTIFAASEQSVAAWDISTENALWHRLDDPGAEKGVLVMNGAAASPDGRTVAMTDSLGRLTTWDVTTGHLRVPPVAVASTAGYGTTGVKFTLDGRRIVVGAGNGTVTVLDAATGHRLEAPLQVAPSAPTGIVIAGTGVTEVVLDPHGRNLVASTGTGELVIIDVATWSVRRRIAAHRPYFNIEAAFSPDGRLIASAAEDGLTLHDAASGKRLAVFREVSDLLIGIGFSPDGRTLAAGLSNGTVLLIDVAQRRVAGRLIINRGQVGGLTFSPDGRTLAAGSRDGTLTIWDVASRQMIGEPLTGQRDAVIQVVYAADSTRVAASAWDGTGVVYDVDQRSWARRACELAGRNLTRAEWAQLLTGRPYHRTCSQWP